MLAEDTETGYQVTFVTEHATVDVYYTQDYTAPSEENISSAIARNSDTGEIDVTGDGQVNFKVNVDEDYEIISVTADKNYKNLKDLSDNMYRRTKIQGEVVVTVETAKKNGEEPIPDPDPTLDPSPTPDPSPIPDPDPAIDPSPTPGTGYKADVVINEIESNGDVTDWVEIYNKGTAPVDISGWYITDDNTSRKAAGKVIPLPEGTLLNPGQFYVFDQNIDFDFGLGAPDEVNLFDNTDTLVEKISWSTHAAGVLARVPDGTGAMTEVGTSTKGKSNNGETTTKPDYKGAIEWPGSDKVITYDEGISMFQSDSSGLDFYKGQLYCINNKKGTFLVMNVNKDGSLDYADGFTQTGKNLAFAHDAANPSSSNPDAEGITVDGNGLAYAAVERDNNNNKVNSNWILQFNPWEAGPTVVASAEWDITSLLPDVPANAGIEATEWVSNSDVAGRLYDENTGAPFDPMNYPNAAASGIFFVALEDNGHVYAFVLNNDGSAQRIADIDPDIGGAMALDYDRYEKILWVGADDGYGNISARIKFNGTASPEVTLVNPPAGMDVTRNNEGFAIAEPEFTVDGQPSEDNDDGTGNSQQGLSGNTDTGSGQQKPDSNTGKGNTGTNSKPVVTNQQSVKSPKTGDDTCII